MNIKPLWQELYPLYDLSRHTPEFTSKDFLMFVINTWKSIARGGIVCGVVGGAAGTIASLVSGNDVGSGAIDGLIKGIILGYAIDVVQYDTRYMIYRIKHTVDILYTG